MNARRGDYHRTLSPLRYPGAKSYLAPVIESLLIENRLAGATFVEAFAGSGAVSLYLLSRGVAHRVILVERDPLIFCLWRAILEQPDDLCALVQRRSVSIACWRRYRKRLLVESFDDDEVLELGFSGLFLNRVTYSGMISAGPIGGVNQDSDYKIDCRFNRHSICKKIKFISSLSDRITVLYGDAIDVLRDLRTELRNDPISAVYYDPPYYVHGEKYYRYAFDSLDHRRLASHVRAAPWVRIVSYDDHRSVAALYPFLEHYELNWNYSARVSRLGNELLMTSAPNPPRVLPGVRLGWRLRHESTGESLALQRAFLDSTQLPHPQ